MIVVIFPVVATKENLDAPPGAFNGIRVFPGGRITEPDAVVKGAMLVTQRAEIVYAVQQSLMTFVPGSIQSRIKAKSVSAVLSGTGTRNVFPDSRSTPPNTH
jgi:hypothetical protein